MSWLSSFDVSLARHSLRIIMHSGLPDDAVSATRGLIHLDIKEQLSVFGNKEVNLWRTHVSSSEKSGGIFRRGVCVPCVPLNHTLNLLCTYQNWQERGGWAVYWCRHCHPCHYVDLPRETHAGKEKDKLRGAADWLHFAINERLDI